METDWPSVRVVRSLVTGGGHPTPGMAETYGCPLEILPNRLPNTTKKKKKMFEVIYT